MEGHWHAFAGVFWRGGGRAGILLCLISCLHKQKSLSPHIFGAGMGRGGIGRSLCRAPGNRIEELFVGIDSWEDVGSLIVSPSSIRPSSLDSEGHIHAHLW